MPSKRPFVVLVTTISSVMRRAVHPIIDRDGIRLRRPEPKRRVVDRRPKQVGDHRAQRIPLRRAAKCEAAIRALHEQTVVCELHEARGRISHEPIEARLLESELHGFDLGERDVEAEDRRDARQVCQLG